MKPYAFKTACISMALLAAGGVGFVLGTLHGPAIGQIDDGPVLPCIDKDRSFGFSFRHPEGFTVYRPFEHEEDGAKRIWFAQKNGVDAFEISLIKYRDQEPLRPELIRRQNPDLAMSDPELFTVNDRPAVGLTSHFDSTGPAYIVMAISENSYLYQFTAPAAFKDTLLDILKTLKFPSP